MLSARSIELFNRATSLLCTAAALVFLAALMVVPSAYAQSSQGSVSITVIDPGGATIPGATLELRDLGTNDQRTATTTDGGTYRFVDLNNGNYALSVSKEGFSKEVVSPILVQVARVTDISVTLKVGALNQTVEVSGEGVTVLETSSNMIGTTIDMKQIEDLPLGGRDLTQLSFLTPGYNGTWNGLPSIDQGNNIDGVIGSPTRMKFTGNAQPVVSARLEDIGEMTVQTDQLDLDQGFGQATMQINFITRRGTNAFHGRVYEDFRNADLNANSWANNGYGIQRPPLILNDFGGSVGGPVIKNKLFFFGSFSMSKSPGTIPTSQTVLLPAAQQGNFQYVGTDGSTHTVNVLNLAHSFNSALPGTINPTIASELAGVNGALKYGSISGLSDPNLATLNWVQPSPTTFYYPTFRIDYNATDKQRLHLAFNETKEIQPAVSPAYLPGPAYSDQIAGTKNNNYTASFGWDWIISPTVVNEFKGGFLYNAVWYAYNAAPLYVTSIGLVNWGIAQSGQNFNLGINTYYPVFNASDSVSWQKEKHNIKFGFSWWREQDHYYNAPAGWPTYNFGLANGDPALAAFSNSGSSATLPNASSAQLAEAEQLYAVLTGRLSGVNGQYGVDPSTKSYIQKPGSSYNLDELIGAWGLFAQDSFRIRPNLTINYGLRWDFTGDDHDLTSEYSGATPAAIYGPTPIGDLFAPGVLGSNTNPVLVARPHQYQPWNVSPQPTIGLAWSPDFKDGFLGKLTGSHKTVIRTGYSLRRFTEPQQYFWNQATNYGSFYYQNFNLYSNNTGTTGSFAPGSLSLGQPLPPYAFNPAAYSPTNPEANATFESLTYLGNDVNGLNPNIAQPYTQSWNFGIQRELPGAAVLEVRYNGSHTIHQWLSEDTNEVNVFENGFLTQFQAAQQNLKINQQHNISSFADNGYAGQTQTPIFNAAFAGESSGGTGVPFADYGNTNFINYLNTGQVGAFANILAGANYNPQYFCNLVGSSFKPCLTNAGFTGKGAGYPINFFQTNPYSAGQPVYYTDSNGYSNYNALQVDYRQKPWHGLQFDANYTWSHTLGLATPNNWTSQSTQYTLRDMRDAYGPTLFDLHDVIQANGTYDLPFGKGRQFLNHGGVTNAILGGWTLGDIFTFQTGAPMVILGGNETFNDYGDGGVILNGVTRSQLQSSVGVYSVGNAGYVNALNPTYITPGVGANTSYLRPNTTAGTFGQIFYMYGPHQTYNDMSLSKRIAITERVRFVLQGEFLNAFNHPVFAFNTGAGANNLQSPNFGTAYNSNNPRNIELRANIEF
jgi:Carboxypeptidase regulatory-like domain